MRSVIVRVGSRRERWCDRRQEDESQSRIDWDEVHEVKQELVPETGWSILKGTISYSQRGWRRWPSDSDHRWRMSAARRLSSDEIMQIWRFGGCKNWQDAEQNSTREPWKLKASGHRLDRHSDIKTSVVAPWPCESQERAWWVRHSGWKKYMWPSHRNIYKDSNTTHRRNGLGSSFHNPTDQISDQPNSTHNIFIQPNPTTIFFIQPNPLRFHRLNRTHGHRYQYTRNTGLHQQTAIFLHSNATEMCEVLRSLSGCCETTLHSPIPRFLRLFLSQKVGHDSTRPSKSETRRYRQRAANVRLSFM